MQAHICHVFPSFVSGGSQVRTCRIMNALGAAYRHSVIALDGQHSAAELLDSGVNWAAVPAPQKAGSWSTVRALRGLFQGLSPDLVCTYNWGAIDGLIAASWLGSAGVLHHEDGFGADEAQRLKHRRTWMRRLVLPRAHGVLVPSRTLQSIAIERWKLHADHVHHIPIGIQTESFPLADGNPELRKALGVRAESWVIGSVGHLRPEKNPTRLVRAFAQLADSLDCHLLMLGEGAERKALEACIQELGLGSRVSLVGHQSAPAAYYQAMDCLAISSDTEQMPVNLLEAMAAGLPVVSTDVGDVRHMLPASQSNQVIRIDRNDEAATCQALGTAMAQLAGDRAGARSMGQENHAQLLRTYSFEAMLSSFEGHYQDALSRAARQRASST